MVFFVCEGCNETLKRNQVEKHVPKCRSCHAVTCVDCSVTFYGDDYQAHVTCVSEAEKYEKTLYKEKPKKLNPQEAWTALIEETAARSSEAPKHIQSYLHRLTELGNVPRNKKKFENFLKNSLRLYNDSITNDMWNFIEKIKAANEAAKAVAVEQTPKDSEKSVVAATETKASVVADVGGDNDEEDGNKEATNKKKKDKKRKREAGSKESTPEHAAEVVAEGESSGESKKDKKKKKKKERESTPEVDAVEVEVHEPVVQEEVKKEKKAKKDKKKSKE